MSCKVVPVEKILETVKMEVKRKAIAKNKPIGNPIPGEDEPAGKAIPTLARTAPVVTNKGAGRSQEARRRQNKRTCLLP